MMAKTLIATLLACAALASSALAQTQSPAPAPAGDDDLRQYLVNVPGSTWYAFGAGQTNRPEPHVGPRNADVVEVSIAQRTANTWDVGAVSPLNRAISAGDVVLAAVYLRAPRLADGQTLPIAALSVNQTVAPYDIAVTTPVAITNQWKLYFVSGHAAKGLTADHAAVGIQLGQAPGVVELSRVEVYDLGPDADVAQLPHN